MNGTIPSAVLQQVLGGAATRDAADSAARLIQRARSLQGRPDERARVAELAREFESMITRQILQQMRQSLLGEDEDEDGGLGRETLAGTIDVELARVLSNGRGLGLAEALRPVIERQTGARDITPMLDRLAAPLPPGNAVPLPAQVAGAALAPVAGPAPVAAPAVLLPRESRAAQRDAATPPVDLTGTQPFEPPSNEGPALPLPLKARVTSRFGWRQDPLGAGLRFHRGVDIAAPRGSQVPAAADGRVAFAGHASGYGNTVVIEHADGTSTRYGHLDEIGVNRGDVVPAGGIIGTVGSTGRCTGPHLHFELLQDGRHVNPEQAAARYAGALKVRAVVAD
jgi:murein DD-endopeptidase MepM/ murein hydrolase activator NlpD